MQNSFEDRVVHFLEPRLADPWRIDRAVPVHTQWAPLSIGVRISGKTDAIGIECGPHIARRLTTSLEEWQDALVLSTGVVRTIYRVPGMLFENRPFDCLQALALAEPTLFSSRAIAEIGSMATRATSSDAREVTLRLEAQPDGYHLRYSDTPADSGGFEIVRDTLALDGRRRNFLQVALDFAIAHPGIDVSTLQSLWKAAHPLGALEQA